MISLSRIRNKVIFVTSISNLGNGFFSKLKIAFIIFWISFRDKIKIPNKQNFIFNLKIFNKEISFVFTGTHSELLMIEEILCRKSYDVEIENPKNIIDLGANIGISTIFFASKYPNSNILSFEPNPDIFDLLKFNSSSFDNVKIFKLAVSDKKDKINFFKNPKHNSSSFEKRFDNDKEVTVDSVSLDDLVDDFNLDSIDILKFDIEGSEFKVFQDFKNWSKINIIIGEIHEDLSGGSSFDLLKKINELFDLKVEDGGKSGRFIVIGYKND